MFTDVTFFPDLDGEVTSVTDANGFETTFAYDNLGLLVGESEETEVTMGSMTYNTMEPVATYAYNPDSDLLAVTDGDNHTVTSTYNALNEETSVTNPDGYETQFTYDGDGDVLTVTDGLDHMTTYTYDAVGDVSPRPIPPGAARRPTHTTAPASSPA